VKALGGKNSYESIKRYEDKAYDKVLVRMPKGRKDEIQAFAAQTGESVNGFINRAIGEAMGESPQQPAGAPQGEGAILTPAALKTAQEAAQRAGETVPAFVSRSVETQAQRDKVMQAMRTKEKAPDKSET
jgi:predicted HicB family RNase H-like nuclease